MRKQQQTEPPRPFPERLWNIRETADFLGFPVSTLYYWSYRGEGGPRILRVGKVLRYNPYDVIEWAKAQAA
jgi:predicted DNA-binding transcriptional regulator AlpA